MSFTIYQNNQKQIEIITRPKMGSCTIQHQPGLIYNHDEHTARTGDPSAPPFKLKDGWSRFDGYGGENNNNHFGPTSFDNLTWLKYLDTNNTKYFLYRNPIQKYASGLTQIYYYGQIMITPLLIVPEGMDPNNPQKHLVLPNNKELHRAKPGTKSVNPNYVSELLHYYQTQPDSFFENYGDQIGELDPSYKNLQYTDPHVTRGLIHAVILKFLLPRKTRLTLLEDFDPLLETLSDSSLTIHRDNVTNDLDAIQPGFALDMHNIKTTMAKRFNDVITNESSDYSKFLSLEIKIWDWLQQGVEPIDILKMIVSELNFDRLNRLKSPILFKDQYLHIISRLKQELNTIF